MNKKRVKIAFFDVDGTISNEALTKAARKKQEMNGFISQKEKADLYYLKRDYKSNRSDPTFFDTYVIRETEILLDSLKGFRAFEIEELAKQVVEEYSHEVYIYSRNLIETLKRKGFLLIAISGSPSFLVKAFAEKYGFYDYIGNGYQMLPNGSYELCEPITWENKDQIVNQLIKKHGWQGKIDKMVSVGDTAGDFSMLEMADCPIAINPSRPLLLSIAEAAQKSKEKKWYYASERKDHIYQGTIPGDIDEGGNIIIDNAKILLNGKSGIDFLVQRQQDENLPESELLATKIFKDNYSF